MLPKNYRTRSKKTGVIKIPTVRLSEKSYNSLLALKAEAQMEIGHVISLSWVLDHVIMQYLDKLYQSEGFGKK